MQFGLSLADIFGLIAGTAGAMLTLVLIHARYHKTLWLAGFVATFSYALLSGIWRSMQLPHEAVWLTNVMGALSFLSLPFLYFYVCEALGRTVLGKWLHFVPASVAAGVIAVWPDINRLYLHSLLLLQGVMYLVVLLRLILAFRRQVQQQYSNLTNIDVPWLQWMIAALLLLALFDSLAFPLLRYVGFSVSFGQAAFNFLGVLYLFWLARGATDQQFAPMDHTIEFTPKAHTPYQNTTLDAASAQALARDLRAAMKDQQLYLNQELTLRALADAAGISAHITSEVLNNTIGQSFYDFVNEHRINIAKSKLEHTDASILDIAFASGFNNKVSFNKAFRKFVSQTPTEFRKQQNQLS